MGFGKYDAIFRPIALSRLAGMILPANVVRAPVVRLVVSGSYISCCVPFLVVERLCEKSPLRSSAVGTVDVLVTASTGGRSPALSSWLRRKLEAELGPELAELLDRLAAERDALHAEGRTTEGLDWDTRIEALLAELQAQRQVGPASKR